MRIRIGLILVALLASASANAVTIFTATLGGDQENPPNMSTASGFATLTLNDDQTRLEIDITLLGVDLDGMQTPDDPDDNVTASHIHAAPAGKTGRCGSCRGQSPDRGRGSSRL
jgi:hypothetical protein